ncbi:MAG: hypothetical protein IE909_05860 [Campylobacterales bacterium]|nr:hypothetical protein [Campylobacterales bacterium]
MTRSTPPSDWVVYLVVIAIAIATMYGKYLIAKDDKSNQQQNNDGEIQKTQEPKK